MTREEIVRWFRKFRYDPEFRTASGAHTVPITCICEYAGVSRPHVYRILRDEIDLTENYDIRLTAAINAVKQGLRWYRRARGWEINRPHQFAALPRYERPTRYVTEEFV